MSSCLTQPKTPNEISSCSKQMQNLQVRSKCICLKFFTSLFVSFQRLQSGDSRFLRPWVQTSLTPLSDKIALGFSPWNVFLSFSVNLPTAQRAFAMRSSFKVLQFPFRSVCTHCSQCSSVRSYCVKIALRNRLAFFHLHCHSEFQTDFTYFF